MEPVCRPISSRDSDKNENKYNSRQELGAPLAEQGFEHVRFGFRLVRVAQSVCPDGVRDAFCSQRGRARILAHDNSRGPHMATVSTLGTFTQPHRAVVSGADPALLWQGTPHGHGALSRLVLKTEGNDERLSQDQKAVPSGRNYGVPHLVADSLHCDFDVNTVCSYKV